MKRKWLAIRNSREGGPGSPHDRGIGASVHRKNKAAYLAIIVSVVVLDIVSKHLIEQHIPLDENVQVIPGFFRLTHLENPGAAFSLFAGLASSWRTPALIAFPVIALIVISILLWKSRQTNVITVALSMIFGGALGNLWGRLMSGSVTDFLDFYVGAHHWYPFNIADTAIVMGELLLAWRILVMRRLG